MWQHVRHRGLKDEGSIADKKRVLFVAHMTDDWIVTKLNQQIKKTDTRFCFKR